MKVLFKGNTWSAGIAALESRMDEDQLGQVEVVEAFAADFELAVSLENLLVIRSYQLSQLVDYPGSQAMVLGQFSGRPLPIVCLSSLLAKRKMRPAVGSCLVYEFGQELFGVLVERIDGAGLADEQDYSFEASKSRFFAANSSGQLLVKPGRLWQFESYND